MPVWLIAVPLLIGGVVVVGGILVSRRSGQSFVEERLGIMEAEEEVSAVAVRRRSPVGAILDRELTRRGLGANLATQLARADIKLTVGEFVAMMVILVIVATVLAYLMTGGDPVITVVACLGGFFAPRIYIGVVRGQRLNAFNNQLGDAINLLVNSLRAGYSILQAMEAVAQEMGQPIAAEFGRVVREVQLGLTLEVAMEHMLRRITSDDLDMMVTAINVQREVGGNLAEVLDSISFTIRERVRIKGEIRAQTAYGRGAGTMISLVPVVLAGVIYLINPEYMSLLIEHRCGWVMLAVAVIGIVLGYVIINKIVQIDV